MDKGSPAPRFEHETMKVGDTIDNNTSSLFTINKLEEQQLPIFRQRPQLVIYKHLEMVGAVTYLVHLFFYLCRIQFSSFGHVFHLVGLLAGFDKSFDIFRNLVHKS